MDATFNVVIASCMDDVGRVRPAGLLRSRPRFVCFSGDGIYSDMGGSRLMRGTRWDPDIFWREGAANPPVNARSSQRIIDRYELWNGRNGMPEWREFWQQVDATGADVLWQFDDHDAGWDNLDHTLLGFQNAFPDSFVGTNLGNGSAPWGQVIAPAQMTQADVLYVWRQRQLAKRWLLANYTANPTSPGSNGDIPSAMIGTATAADYDIDYFLRDYGPAGELGGTCVRFIFPDSVSYKSPKSATENSAKTLWGAVQTVWAQEAMLDAKARGFGKTILVITKDVYGADNLDGMGNYTTWRNTQLLQFIQDNNLDVAVVSGDKHLPHISMGRVDQGGITDLLVHCACPFGSRHSSMAQHKELVWSAPRADLHVYERVTINAAARTVELAMLDAFDHTEWAVDVLAFGQRLPVSSYRRPLVKPQERSGYDRTAITVPATGTAWQNTSGRSVNVVIVGGTVSDVAVSRDGVTYDSLGTTRQVNLAHGEFIKPTYSSTPTMFFYPLLTASGI